MNLHVDKNSTIPPFQQIKNQIKAAIVAGEYPEDTALPSVREVSRVTHVALTTAQRVFTDLRNENYIYSLRGKGNFVKSLADRINQQIHVFLPSSSLSFFTKILQGVFSAAYSKNWEVIVHSLDTDKLLWNEQTIEMLTGAIDQNAAVIFIEEAFGDVKQKCIEAAKIIPFVTIEWKLKGASSVTNDYEQSMYQAMRYLVEEKKSESFLVLKGRDYQYNASQKIQGIHKVVDEFNFLINKDVFFRDSDFDAITGYEVTHEFFRDKSVDTVICANDYEAIGVIGALTEKGLLVGKDVSVLGYGDMTDRTTNYFPLSTVSQNLAQVGLSAVEEIFKLSTGESVQDITVLAHLEMRNT